MKYLKSFNHLNESSENEPLWETVTMNDYLRREEVHGKDEDFDDIDKDKIRKGIRYGGHDYSMCGFSSIEIDITNDDNGDGCKRFVEYVKKSPDEWFYVKEFYYFWHRGEKTSSWRQAAYRPQKDSESIYESYIKCDTLEGLIQYIKSRREYLYTL
jgi:hypothetical protein